MANVTYDPQIIYTFANALYAKANRIIMSMTALGVLAGAAVGYLGGSNLSTPGGMDGLEGMLAAAGAVVLGLVGYQMGTTRAFTLKLQAQLALAQVKIEENSRRSSSSAAA